MPDDVFHVESSRVRDTETLQVPAGAQHAGSDFVFVALENEQRARRGTGRLRRSEQQRGKVFGFFQAQRFAVDDRDRFCDESIGQRSGKSHAALLLIEVGFVGARLRSEHDAAVAPLRRANRAMTSPPRALLPPGLTAAAADFIAFLRRSRSGALIRKLPKDGAKDRVRFACQRWVEERLRRLRGSQRRHQLRAAARLRLTVSVISTSPLIGPGTGPRTSSRLRSASARTTSRF